MKPISASIISCILMPAFLLVGCNSTDDNDNFDSDLADLVEMRTAIEELANTSTCNDNSECFYIGLGSKPCGGPWSYLIYSSSINTAELENKVEAFNNKQADFNDKYGQISDCMFVGPPTDVICENGVCQAQF